MTWFVCRFHFCFYRSQKIVRFNFSTVRPNFAQLNRVERKTKKYVSQNYNIKKKLQYVLKTKHFCNIEAGSRKHLATRWSRLNVNPDRGWSSWRFWKRRALDPSTVLSNRYIMCERSSRSSNDVYSTTMYISFAAMSFFCVEKTVPKLFFRYYSGEF